MPHPSIAVVWFRRDLRLHDHPALQHAVHAFDAIVPLFVVDPAILEGRWRSANRRWFLAEAVRSLGDDLAARGAPLAVLRGDPADVVPAFARRVGATAVTVSRDYAPHGRQRDERVRAALASNRILFEAGRGLLAHEPEEIGHEDGTAFTVFSPFHRRWHARPFRPTVAAPERIASVPLPASDRNDVADLVGDTTPTADRSQLLQPSEAAARARLERWATSDELRDYATGRDRLDRDGTSRLSQDLRWGLLSPIEVLEWTAGDGEGRARYRSEIAWRDFYAHLLWHQPRVAQESFRREMEDVAWERDADLIETWKAGRTGYPIVDAAMRQLLTTGWMHNRARMIVASFLTKHLGVDWRVGEAHFMEHLVDGDPASNNGGWQWAASTGTDPQPWFRIFNPTLQGRRHDPDGDYVRRWVPDLAARRDLLGPDIHEPPPGAYLPKIVDHAEARRRALAAYEARASS